VEPDKIFAFGHSKGGVFAYSLACHIPSTFNAIGVTAATATQTGISCTPTNSIEYPAVFHVHNLRDMNVPFLGGGNKLWPPAEDGLQFWAAQHGCTLPIDDYDFGQTMCLEADCQSKSVELCLLGTDVPAGLGDDPTNPVSPHLYKTYNSAFEAYWGRNIRDSFVDKYFR
jgi:polyhydroxybutyrate depolymerase